MRKLLYYDDDNGSTVAMTTQVTANTLLTDTEQLLLNARNSLVTVRHDSVSTLEVACC